ncbi:hypothetical protein FMM05_20335 [Flavobacterium zepuense]|uniref:Uncharacterized protein n=1 Tax=Flavobacterium zepuense TaxID=2593302 RepID=A0A552UTB6_9FLAO|nr:hypothetical protein [Flavobacterium zepuense]TRW21427.1 hypothetical protein FMM05_20335 [Flavobacterium zepuense]
MDYSALESDFECACDDVIKNLGNQYKTGYQSGGLGMLEAFFDLIKSEFDKAAQLFIQSNNISENPDALKLIHTIAKKHAKKCVEFYGRVV